MKEDGGHMHPQRKGPKPMEVIRKKEADYKQLSTGQKCLFWIGILSFLGAVILVCYAFWSEPKPFVEKLTDILPFLLTGVLGLIFTAIQVFPNMLRYIRDAIHISVDIHMFTTFTNILFSCLLLASLSFTSWSLFKPPATKVIEIGVSLPLSGDDQAEGHLILNGITIAVNGQGEIGGYHISLVPYDDQSNQNNVANFQQFVADHPQLAAMIGPFNSGVAVMEIPETSARSIPLISPANTADCLTLVTAKTQGCDPEKLGAADNATYFRLATVDSVRAEKFATYLSALYPHGTVAIFSDTTIFGDSFATEFSSSWQRTGGTVLFDKSTINANDYTYALSGLKTIPDMVFFSGTGSAGVLLLDTMQQFPRLSHTAFVGAAPIMIDAFKNYLENPQSGPAYAIAPVADANCTVQGRDFVSKYDIQSGIPTPYSANGYDAAKIVLEAINVTLQEGISPPADPSDTAQEMRFRQEIGKNMKSLNKKNGITYEGLTGDYIFNDQGDVIDTNGTQADGKVSIYKFDQTSQNWQNAQGCQDNNV
jgi:branched-chain amino acid transport system substrate-binding protein